MPKGCNFLNMTTLQVFQTGYYVISLIAILLCMPELIRHIKPFRRRYKPTTSEVENDINYWGARVMECEERLDRQEKRLAKTKMKLNETVQKLSGSKDQ